MQHRPVSQRSVSQRAEPVLSTASILIVAAETAVIRELQHLLRSFGYTICGTATTGRDAVERALATTPDLVLMDTTLEDGTPGSAVMAQMCAHRPIPVVYLATSPQEVAPADGTPPAYLLKPIDPCALRAVIGYTLLNAPSGPHTTDSNPLLSGILHSIADAVIATDACGRVVFLNDSAAHLTGWNATEAHGQMLSAVLSVVDAATHTPADCWTDILSGSQQAATQELLLLSRTDGTVPVELRAAPLRTGDGRISGVAVQLRLQHLSDSRQHTVELSRLTEINPSPIVCIDTGTTICYANAAADGLLAAWHTSIGASVPVHIAEAVAAARRSPTPILTEEHIADHLYTLTFVASPQRDIVHLYASDSTQLRRSDSELRESHRRFRDILEKVPLIALQLDAEGRVTFCNEFFCQLIGMPREQIIGTDWFANFLPKDEQVFVQTMFRDHIPHGTIAPYYDNSIVTADGERRMISWTNTVLRDSTGTVTGLATIGIDITERRLETQALRDSEERYRRLVELSPLGIVIHVDGAIVFGNSAAAEIVGLLSPRNLIGRNVFDFVAPGYRHTAEQRINAALNGLLDAEMIEEQFLRSDGTVVDVEVAAIPTTYNNRPAVQVVFLDISERKESQRRAEQQLLQLQSLYDLLYHAGRVRSIEELYETGLRALERAMAVSRSALLIADAAGVMQFTVWHNLSDTYRARVTGHSPWAADDPDPAPVYVDNVFADQSIAAFHDAFAEEGIGALAFVPVRLNGVLAGKLMMYFDEPHVFTPQEKLLVDTIGNHLEFALYSLMSGNRLRESEEKFRNMSENTSALIAIVADTCLYVNPAFERFTGYSAAEASALRFEQIFGPEVRSDIAAAVRSALADRVSFRRECTIVDKQGAVRWFDITIDCISYGGQDAAFLTGVDITERRQDNLLIESQKEILQMIAHGDPLSAIFPAVFAFAEQQAAGLCCLFYRADASGVLRLFDSTAPAWLRGALPEQSTGDDDNIVAASVRARAHICECLMFGSGSARDVRMACSYPVLDSRKTVLGAVVVVNNTYERLNPRMTRVLQIVAQLLSLALERDLTFAALEKALQDNFRRVVQTLQHHVFKLEQRNGEYFYTLSEGQISELAGLRTDNVAGSPLSALFSPDIYQGMERYLRRAFNGEAVTFEEPYGNQWFLTTYEPVFDDSGTVIEVVGSSVDITRQKLVEEELRTSEERYRLIVDTLPIGIMKMVRTEQGWNYEYSNAQAAIQTGYSHQDMPNIDNESAVHPDDQDTLGELWLRWLQDPTRKSLHMTYRYRHKKGHYIWLDNYAIKITNPRTSFQEVIQMAMDITEQKKAEHELHTALAKERELSSLKTRFVSTVSHEFRTPLTGILMSTELLERYFDKLAPEQRLEEISKIKVRVNELTELMDDFLLQSSLQSMAERFRPEPTDLARLASACIHELRSILTEHPHTLLTTIPDNLPMIHGDPRLLRHIVQNLLSNAVKYSPTNSTIRFALRQEAGELVVEVRDQGIGIPEEELPRLFTPFFRASNTGKIKGTGLGLSIIKEFVEIHNGTIMVHSLVGHGSTFVVRLPQRAERVEQTNDLKA